MTGTERPDPAQITPLLERATTLRFLSLLFQPPSSERAGQLGELARAHPAGLRQSAEGLAAALAGELAEAEAAYHRTLGGSGRCRDCASDHLPPSLGSKAEVGRVAGLYEAFGFSGARELPAPPDSAAAELSFAGYLLLKQSYALQRGDPLGVEHCRAGYRLFVEEHLRPWLPGLLDELEQRSQASFYIEAARFAREALVAVQVLDPGRERVAP